MVRSSKKPRRLVVGDTTFLWSVRHEHHVVQVEPLANSYQDCREILSVRLEGATGRLMITFAQGPGRVVADGIGPAGIVGEVDGDRLNLNKPGTVRALIDEAVAHGWSTNSTAVEHLNGWDLFDAVARR